MFCWSQELFEIFWPLFILAGALLWAPHQKCHCSSVTIEQHEILHTNTQHSHDRNSSILQSPTTPNNKSALVSTQHLLTQSDISLMQIPDMTLVQKKLLQNKILWLLHSLLLFLSAAKFYFSQKFCYSLYV